MPFYYPFELSLHSPSSPNSYNSMTTNLNIITLRMVRYSDKSNILLTYSREAGPVSFAIAAGAGREALRRRALLMPLSVNECVANIRPGHELALMSGLQTLFPTTSLHSNSLKLSVGMMLAELLTAILRGAPVDENLFDYIVGGIRALELLPANKVANFHLVFIYGLGKMLGIEPDTATFRKNRWLDMRDGVWRDVPAPHSDMLTPSESKTAYLLGKLSYSTMHLLRINHDDRNNILEKMLRYMSIHYTPLAESLKSPELFRSLFS